jgi:hypothetical protein
MTPKVVFLAAALLAAPAAAQPVGQPPSYTGDLTGFSGNPQALPRAITALEHQGAQVMEIRYDGSKGPGYAVVLARAGQVEFDRAAEPVAGVTVITSSTEPAWMLGWRGRAELKAARKAKVDLATAVRSAEKDANGAAVAAGIAQSAANPTSDVKAYNVLVRTASGRLQRVAIDADTGARIQNPDALRKWP